MANTWHPLIALAVHLGGIIHDIGKHNSRPRYKTDSVLECCYSMIHPYAICR